MIFNALADALQWIAEQRGVSYLRHFLDDFVTAGSPHSDECDINLQLLMDTCDRLGLSMVTDKREN